MLYYIDSERRALKTRLHADSRPISSHCAHVHAVTLLLDLTAYLSFHFIFTERGIFNRASVRPSVCPSVSTLYFEPTDLWPWSFACVWVTTMLAGYWNWTEGYRSRSTRSVSPRPPLRAVFLIFSRKRFSHSMAQTQTMHA